MATRRQINVEGLLEEYRNSYFICVEFFKQASVKELATDEITQLKLFFRHMSDNLVIVRSMVRTAIVAMQDFGRIKINETEVLTSFWQTSDQLRILAGITAQFESEIEEAVAELKKTEINEIEILQEMSQKAKFLATEARIADENGVDFNEFKGRVTEQLTNIEGLLKGLAALERISFKEIASKFIGEDLGVLNAITRTAENLFHALEKVVAQVLRSNSLKDLQSSLYDLGSVTDNSIKIVKSQIAHE